MKLAELRAQHPGLYQAAAEEGRSEEYQRVVDHIAMGDAIGNSPVAHRGIKSGHTVESWLARYEDAASSSDETAAAFIKARDSILGRKGQPTVRSNRPLASEGGAEASTSRPTGTPNLGGRSIADAVADRLWAELGKPEPAYPTAEGATT